MLASTASRPRRAQWIGVWQGAATVAAVGGVVFAVAYPGATFALGDRATLGVLLAWGLLCAALARLWPAARIGTGAQVVAGSLLAFACWTLASAAWTSAENAYDEFSRPLLYLLVVLAAFGARRGSLAHCADGTAIAITAVAVLALGSRVLPDIVTGHSFPLASGWETRLSYPLGYWNGLAILIGLVVPLLLRVATTARPLWVRGLGVAPFPALAATIYLTSSRGGVAVALVGAALFVLLTAGRWSSLAAAAASGAGAAGGISVVIGRHALTEGPLGSHAAVAEGHGAALWILALCAALGVVYGAAAGPLAPRWPGRARSAFVVLGIAALGTVAAAAAAHPFERFRAFKAVPTFGGGHGTLQEHLLAAGGSGRWQYWESALHQFTQHPWLGDGAGSWGAWWAQHGTLPLIAHDAHSLYLETLAELGVLGLLLLLVALTTGLVVGVRRVRAAAGDQRVILAAVFAAFVAYLLSAAIDWVWELTIVSVVGFLLLGLLVAPAGAVDDAQPARPARPGRLARVAVPVLAVAAAAVFAVLWLGERQLASSRDAAAAGDWSGAIRAAASARAVEPWAASPYLQLALVAEDGGDLHSAGRWIDAAIARDHGDWRLWLVSTRIETKLGDVHAARRSLAQLRTLNPRGTVLSGLGG